MVTLFSRRKRFILTGSFLVLVLLILSIRSLIAADIDSRFRVIYSLDYRHNDREIISLIDNADAYVYFAVYYFNKNNIADALIRAKHRGVIVWGIMDNEASLDTNKNILAELRAAGIAIETQKHPEGIMHVKALVTDHAYASGSYNWTSAATNVNDEILEIGSDESVRRQYLDIIKKILTTNQ